jgi:hypothetical protein
LGFHPGTGSLFQDVHRAAIGRAAVVGWNTENDANFHCGHGVLARAWQQVGDERGRVRREHAVAGSRAERADHRRRAEPCPSSRRDMERPGRLGLDLIGRGALERRSHEQQILK